MSRRKDTAVDELASVLDSQLLRALAEPARLAILRQLLLMGRSDINSIADRVAQERSVVSRHLRIMEDAGLLRIEKDGRHRYVELLGNDVVKRLRALVDTVERAIAMCCPPRDPKDG